MKKKLLFNEPIISGQSDGFIAISIDSRLGFWGIVAAHMKNHDSNPLIDGRLLPEVKSFATSPQSVDPESDSDRSQMGFLNLGQLEQTNRQIDHSELLKWIALNTDTSIPRTNNDRDPIEDLVNRVMGKFAIKPPSPGASSDKENHSQVKTGSITFLFAPGV